jgi:membrane protein insertase Oxa1/YidC/SpoIIIJ
MFGFFAMQMPAGLSIYFIVSNLIGMAIQWGTNRLLNSDDKASQPTRPKLPHQSKPSNDDPSTSNGNRRGSGRGYKKS